MAKTITVDEALAQLGGFGLFQWLIYLGASIAEMAVTYQIFLLTFITAEPKWVCKNESVICNFTEPIGITDDDYKARCDMPRDEWKFADDFTSIVTEVGMYYRSCATLCIFLLYFPSENQVFKFLFRVRVRRVSRLMF
jgi:hypothetical protein